MWNLPDHVRLDAARGCTQASRRQDMALFKKKTLTGLAKTCG